jgi:hypothetical protein
LPTAKRPGNPTRNSEFPGSIRIPGTDTAFRVGGQARMTLVHTLAPLGADDRFVTSSIRLPISAALRASTSPPTSSRASDGKFAANTGWGIGRYITDLGTLGGQDAVFNPSSDSLQALPAYSAYVGYERLWKPTFHVGGDVRRGPGRESRFSQSTRSGRRSAAR